jgi:D-alanyl-D-alanine carboxypeptidase
MDQALKALHDVLGIHESHLSANRLPFHAQPALEDLEVVDIDCDGKPFILISSTAQAWRKMKTAAAGDKIELFPFSGFRSYVYQKNLIEKRLQAGRQLESILTHVAIPGFSEHHSGRAIDIHAPGRPVLEEEFELTDSFAWLRENAHKFDFRLSYPRGNTLGIIYEPWHWFYEGV